MKRVALIAVTIMATWTARWYSPTTCEINKPRLNVFNGKMEMPSVQYAVACWESHEEKMAKSFPDKPAAEKFFEDCDAQSSGAFVPNAVRCTERTIEEIHE